MAHVRKLRGWELGMTIVREVQQMVSGFPRSGVGELKNQMVRAAISIPSNVAEGAGRGSAAEFRRFLHIALGSCRELETQIEIVRRMGIVDVHMSERVAEYVDHEGRMLTRLIRVVK